MASTTLANSIKILALDGANGAAHVLKCLLAEADLLMAVNGYPTIAAIRAAGAVRVD